MVKNITYAVLTSTIIVSAGCGGHRTETTNPSSSDTTPVPLVEANPPTTQTVTDLGDATEPGDSYGTFGVQHVTVRSANASPDADQWPPFNVWLRAAEDGRLSGFSMNQRSCGPGDLGVLRGTIMGIREPERGAGSIQDRVRVVLYCDYSVRYEHLIDVITAVSGFRDRNDKIVVLIKNIGVSPSGTTPPDRVESATDAAGDSVDAAARRVRAPEFPLDVVQGDRLQLPESKLARPPEIPYREMIDINVMRSGTIVLHGERLSLDGLCDRMKRQHLILKSMGATRYDATITIRADKDCPAGRIQDLIETCHGQGFERFALLAMETPWYPR